MIHTQNCRFFTESGSWH